MDKFILYKENINVSDNIIYSLGSSLLTFIIAAATVYCLYYIVALFFTPPINNKERFKKNERQLFRIDHDDVFEEYQLVDKNNNKIKISKEEYEELRKGDK